MPRLSTSASCLIVLCLGLLGLMRVLSPSESIVLVDSRCVTTRVALTSIARGDVDGDGRVDSAATEVHLNGQRLCGISLAVTLGGHRRIAVSLAGNLVDLRSGNLPNVEVLANVDRVPGAEIVVRVEQGAAESRASVYTVRRERLMAFRFPQGVIAYGGGATHIAGVDCAESGGRARIVALRAGTVNNSDTLWRIRRDTYALRGSKARKIATSTTSFHGRSPELARAIPALTGRPFPSCTVAQGQRLAWRPPSAPNPGP